MPGFIHKHTNLEVLADLAQGSLFGLLMKENDQKFHLNNKNAIRKIE